MVSKVVQAGSATLDLNEVGRREQSLVLVVEQQRLHGADHDLGRAPVVSVLLVDDRPEVLRQQLGEDSAGLFFEFQPVHQEEDAAGVACPQEQLDNRGCGERLAGAGGHLEEEAVGAVSHRSLERVNGPHLVVAQEPQAVRPDEVGTFVLVAPGGLRRVCGPLGQDDVIVMHALVHQSLWIRCEVLVDAYGVLRWEDSDDPGIAMLEIPEEVQVAVGEDYETAVPRTCIAAGLLFTGQRVLGLGLGFEHDKRKALVVQQQKVDHTALGLDVLEVVAQGVEVVGAELDAGFELDVGGASGFIEEAPASRFEKLVDLDSGRCFVHRRHDFREMSRFFGRRFPTGK